jgi:hypothetical protein
MKNLLDFQLIDIVSTYSSVSCSDFESEEIEKLARSFLTSRGNISPLIVKRVNHKDFDFEVIEGHLEFYAAKRAREIDKFFELIRAIILDKQNAQNILAQLDILKRGIDKSTNNRKLSNSDDLAGRIKNLEDNLSKSVDELREETRKQSNLINRLVKKPSTLSFLEHFNQSPVVELANILDRKGGLSNTKAKTIADLIVETRQQGEFTSLFDIIERVRLKKGRINKNGKTSKAISQETMLKIIDSWSQADSSN